MRVKSKGISQEYLSFLNDWEVLSAYSFTKKLLEKKSLYFEEEFGDISFFFFDGDDEMTTAVLQQILETYRIEYSKRHLN